MSQQTESRQRLTLYRELDDIVTAMKNLAQVELQRLKNLARVQSEAYTTVRESLSALTQCHPLAPASDEGGSYWLVVGSERGFCGGFNEQVVRFVEAHDLEHGELWVVGSRLATKWQDRSGVRVFPGATGADDLAPCSESLLEALIEGGEPREVAVIAQHEGAIALNKLWPPTELPPVTPLASLHINDTPESLRAELEWHSLHQGIAHCLVQSLVRENHYRLQQMEGARDHLSELAQSLQLRINHLRQQEIVEEIEVILGESFSQPLGGGD